MTWAQVFRTLDRGEDMFVSAPCSGAARRQFWGVKMEGISKKERVKCKGLTSLLNIRLVCRACLSQLNQPSHTRALTPAR